MTTQTQTVPEATRSARYRVLVVEDDADIRELIRYNLAEAMVCGSSAM